MGMSPSPLGLLRVLLKGPSQDPRWVAQGSKPLYHKASGKAPIELSGSWIRLKVMIWDGTPTKSSRFRLSIAVQLTGAVSTKLGSEPKCLRTMRMES